MLERPVRPRSSDRPTLATIAADAGVSVATVSKVVNGREDVAPETRALVEDLLARHDYTSPSGRRPVGSGATIEFLIDGDFSAYATQVVDGVVHAAREAGVAVVVGQLRDGTTQRYPAPRAPGPATCTPRAAPGSSSSPVSSPARTSTRSPRPACRWWSSTR